MNPRNNNRNQNNRRNRRRPVRRGLTANRYMTIVTRLISSVASTYSNASIFSTHQCLPEFNTTVVRMARLRHVVVQFSGTEAPLTGLQQMGVQIQMYDPVTGNVVPMTQVIPLNETSTRTVTFRAPAEFARWYTPNDGSALFSIVIYNPTLSATPVSTVATITTSFDLCRNEAVAA